MGTVAARKIATKAFMAGDDMPSTQTSCNTFANCVVDQRPQLVFGDLFEGFLARVELFLAPANLFLAAVELLHAHVLSGVAHLVQALLFVIELPCLFRDRLVRGVERALVVEEGRGPPEMLGLFD